MKIFSFLVVIFISLGFLVAWKTPATKNPVEFYKASNKNFIYTGRIDFSNKELPRFWAPGVYVKAAFEGTVCQIQVNDEMIYGKDHNYISVVIDDMPVKRIKLQHKKNTIIVAENLADEAHVITICKSTESGIGYIEFVGMSCKKLLPPPASPHLKMEFIGDSITAGTGSDESAFPCDSGQWYDQHNAYMSYGPVAARALNAQWHISAVAGIGLTRSCCGMDVIMPDVMDKVNMRANVIKWDFKKFQPDVVTVCLGQNDGITDSVLFSSAYVKFVSRLRAYYPKSTVVCLTSPMADASLAAVQKKYLGGIVSALNAAGDNNVYHYFFSRRYNSGCGDHPDVAEHSHIAAELVGFISKLKHWPVTAIKPPADSAALKKKAEDEYRYHNDWAYLERFKAENEKLPAPQAGENRVVFMGNSITQGWSDHNPEFFKGKPYINRGIGGQTTPQMLLRFRPDVIDLKPKVVVILAGTNDIAGNTGPTSEETIVGNIISMAQLAKANGIRVVLSSIIPVYDYPWKRGLNPVPKIAWINKQLKDYAEKNNEIYLDYYTAMADEKLGLKAELTYDGVHPNKAGYLVMDVLAEAAIKATLKMP